MKVEDIPPSLNKLLRMHWAARRNLSNMWILFVRTGFGTGLEHDKKARVTVTLHHSRLFDKDNAYGACKIIFDALKHEGIIYDDSPKWLEAKVEQAKCPHKQRHTIIELEEA